MRILLWFIIAQWNVNMARSYCVNYTWTFIQQKPLLTRKKGTRNSASQTLQVTWLTCRIYKHRNIASLLLTNKALRHTSNSLEKFLQKSNSFKIVAVTSQQKQVNFVAKNIEVDVFYALQKRTISSPQLCIDDVKYLHSSWRFEQTNYLTGFNSNNLRLGSAVFVWTSWFVGERWTDIASGKLLFQFRQFALHYACTPMRNETIFQITSPNSHQY